MITVKHYDMKISRNCGAGRSATGKVRESGDFLRKYWHAGKFPENREIFLEAKISCFTVCLQTKLCKAINISKHSCCGQPWKWHMFWKRTCDGWCGLQVICRFSWNTKRRKPGPMSDTLQAGACVFLPTHVSHSFPPVPASGSIWVVLWLLFFRSAPSTFPQRRGSGPEKQ